MLKSICQKVQKLLKNQKENQKEFNIPGLSIFSKQNSNDHVWSSHKADMDCEAKSKILFLFSSCSKKMLVDLMIDYNAGLVTQPMNIEQWFLKEYIYLFQESSQLEYYGDTVAYFAASTKDELCDLV